MPEDEDLSDAKEEEDGEDIKRVEAVPVRKGRSRGDAGRTDVESGDGAVGGGRRISVTPLSSGVTVACGLFINGSGYFTGGLAGRGSGRAERVP